jgi:hypothetical protein
MPFTFDPSLYLARASRWLPIWPAILAVVLAVVAGAFLWWVRRFEESTIAEHAIAPEWQQEALTAWKCSPCINDGVPPVEIVRRNVNPAIHVSIFGSEGDIYSADSMQDLAAHAEGTAPLVSPSSLKRQRRSPRNASCPREKQCLCIRQDLSVVCPHNFLW